MDDRESIHRMKDGDMGGLEMLVRRYQVKAVRAAFLITHDEALSEDVVQDTYIRLYQRIRHFDETRPFEPYLMRSVVNAASNAVRMDHRSTSLEEVDPARFGHLLDQAASVEAQVESRQLERELMRCLSQLPPRQRAVIVQRYYLEWSEREMAQALDAPPGTVKWLLHAARSRLRRLLGSQRRTE
jgi:RNA polymerase sigma-70 factor (ECF subfamily)